MEKLSGHENQALKQDLLSIVQKTRPSQEIDQASAKTRLQEQKEAIDQLPPNLVQELRGFYLANHLSARLKSEMVGELVEIFVRSSQKEKITPTGELLLEIMRGPKRFGIKRGKGWLSLANPDTIYLTVTNNGDLVVHEVGEVKKNRLWKRGSKQLRDTGFKQSLANLQSYFNAK